MEMQSGINTHNDEAELSSETLLVEKEALIKAFLELERQEEIQAYLALVKIQEVEVLLKSLKELLLTSALCLQSTSCINCFFFIPTGFLFLPMIALKHGKMRRK